MYLIDLQLPGDGLYYVYLCTKAAEMFELLGNIEQRWPWRYQCRLRLRCSGSIHSDMVPTVTTLQEGQDGLSQLKKDIANIFCSGCNFFSPGRVTVKLDAFKNPIRLYIPYKYILFTLCSKFTLTFSDLWCRYQLIPPSYFEWHFFL